MTFENRQNKGDSKTGSGCQGLRWVVEEVEYRGFYVSENTLYNTVMVDTFVQANTITTPRVIHSITMDFKRS